MDRSEATRHPDLLVGIDGRDDAGVYRLDAATALVQTVDYFTPVVDEAYDWGRIAAANALSDVYAMGGTPLTALTILGWPRDRLPLELAGDVLEGVGDVLVAARCTLVGGHSLDDPEPKVGLAVTGTVHPDRIVSKHGARPGDVLVLTKPIGTGVVSTGIKRGVTDPAWRDAAVTAMVELNDRAAAAMVRAGVRAATDVTGFGLLGHLAEMLGSDVGAEIVAADVPLLPGAWELAERGVVPGGTQRNLAAVGGLVDFGDIDSTRQLLLADAQTSGGLLIALPDDRVAAFGAEVAATRVGRIVADPDVPIRVA